jgi:hypothetical protein
MDMSQESDAAREFARKVRRMPRAIAQFDILGELPPARPFVRMALLDQPSVGAAGEIGERLARYGLTPITVLNAAQALANARGEFTIDDAAREIQRACHCQESVARILVRWLKEAAQYDPHLLIHAG